MDLNLDTLKREILEYLDSAGFTIFHSTPGVMDSQSMVVWDTERHPDYQMFLDVARKTDARLVIFASREFQPSDTEDLRSELDDLELTREEKRDFEKRLRELTVHEGVTCMLELGFDHASRLYVYRVTPDWWQEFLDLEGEIMDLVSGPGMDDDDEPLGDYFSRN